MDNQKLADLINAEWEAKRRAYEAARQVPFSVPVVAPTDKVAPVQEDLWSTVRVLEGAGTPSTDKKF
jgi:hypothetical protein